MKATAKFRCALYVGCVSAALQRGRAGGAIWCGNCSSVSGQSPAPSAPFIPTWRHRDTQPWATLCRVLWGILSVLLARGWVTRHLNPSHAATEIPNKCIPTEQTCITHYTIHMTQLHRTLTLNLHRVSGCTAPPHSCWTLQHNGISITSAKLVI